MGAGGVVEGAGAFGAAAAFFAGAAGFDLQYAAWTLPVLAFAFFGSTNVHAVFASQAALSRPLQTDAGVAGFLAAGAEVFGAGAGVVAGAGVLGAGASCALADATNNPSEAVTAASPSPKLCILLITALISSGWCRRNL